MGTGKLNMEGSACSNWFNESTPRHTMAKMLTAEGIATAACPKDRRRKDNCLRMDRTNNKSRKARE